MAPPTGTSKAHMKRVKRVGSRAGQSTRPAGGRGAARAGWAGQEELLVGCSQKQHRAAPPQVRASALGIPRAARGCLCRNTCRTRAPDAAPARPGQRQHSAARQAQQAHRAGRAWPAGRTGPATGCPSSGSGPAAATAPASAAPRSPRPRARAAPRAWAAAARASRAPGGAQGALRAERRAGECGCRRDDVRIGEGRGSHDPAFIGAGVPRRCRASGLEQAHPLETSLIKTSLLRRQELAHRQQTASPRSRLDAAGRPGRAPAQPRSRRRRPAGRSGGSGAPE